MEEQTAETAETAETVRLVFKSRRFSVIGGTLCKVFAYGLEHADGWEEVSFSKRNPVTGATPGSMWSVPVKTSKGGQWSVVGGLATFAGVWEDADDLATWQARDTVSGVTEREFRLMRRKLSVIKRNKLTLDGLRGQYVSCRPVDKPALLAFFIREITK